MTGAIAAIDCGTNSTRLLIADRNGRELVRIAKVTRLGQGVDATRRLAPGAVHRTLAVLAEFRRDLDRSAVASGRLVATSAVRDAKNGPDFLTAAEKVVGLQAELLSGSEEGKLAFAGATSGLESEAADYVVVDIGGGSTELIAMRSGRIRAISLDLGSVRLTERFFRGDPPGDDEVVLAEGLIRNELLGARRELGPGPTTRKRVQLIGLAGTVATLAALAQGLSVYQGTKMHHFDLSSEVVDAWFKTLSNETSTERRLRAGIAEGREDVILAGVLVLRETMRVFGFESCLASECDILDGLVMSQR